MSAARGKGENGDIVFAGDGSEVTVDIVLDTFEGVVRRDAIVYDRCDGLREGINFGAAVDDVDGLRGLH